MTDLNFKPIDHRDNETMVFLFWLLRRRPAEQSISHRDMPSFKEHVDFWALRPYKWSQLVTTADGTPLGYVYGYEDFGHTEYLATRMLPGHEEVTREVIKWALSTYPAEIPVHVNIAPEDAETMKLYKSLGFRVIQETWRHD